MNRRPHLTLVALIAAGLIGVGLLAIPGSPIEQTPTLGLDLQGGLEVTLKAVPPPNRPLQKSDLDRSVEILRDRVDRLGVAEPEIRKQGDDQIVIDLPGRQEPGAGDRDPRQDRAARALRPRGEPRRRRRSARRASRSRRTRCTRSSPASRRSSTRTPKTTWYLFDDKQEAARRPVADEGQAARRARPSRRPARTGKLPKGWKIFGVPPKTVVLQCGIGEVVCPGVDAVNPTQNYFYLTPLRPARTPDPKKVVPEMTRRRPQALGHARRTSTRRPASRS